uniref:BTB domain-containing protein n=1 Tax=Meloidogyne javanica TaxID=6303 RepID=A0A915ND60_MELJA
MFEEETLADFVIKGEIKIVDCSIDCFRAMLEFFYSGEIEINTFEKIGEDLYAIADKYEVVTLKEVCEHYMAMSITSTNFKKRYDCAKTYGLLMLEKSCIKYIYANREEFLISKEWEEFKSLNGETAFKMIEDAFLEKFHINVKKKNDTSVDLDSTVSFAFGSGI